MAGKSNDEFCYDCGGKGIIKYASYYAPLNPARKLTEKYNRVALCEACALDRGYDKYDRRINPINPVFRG